MQNETQCPPLTTQSFSILHSPFRISSYPQLCFGQKYRILTAPMWFGKNQKRIKLSRQLTWSVGRGQNANAFFWAIGIGCLLIAAFCISRTNTLLRNQANANPQVLGASTDTPNPSTDISFTDYKVAKGETLFTISQKFNLPTETLAQLNDIRPPFNIKAGQTIKIPQ